ncbi:MAG: hypothetical protein HY731_11645 [Candidatus Tectomicrobia bacterium]|nr:hypothetical protein [Candidatus Tectomicrobia bacterium]
MGETPQLFSVLRGLWEFYEVQGELQTARELGKQLLTLAQSLQDPALLLVAHDVLGDTLLWLGEFAPARSHSEQAIALYNPQQHRSLAFLYGGIDPGVACLCWVALTLWHLGYPGQALKRSHEALTLAEERSHPYSLAHAVGFTAMLHQFRWEGLAAQERAEAQIALSTDQGFELYLAMGAILRGCALTRQGQIKEGMTQMRQGLAAWQTTGAELLRPYFLVLLAEAYGNAGQIEEGLSVLTEALAAAEKSEERWWEAELYRLKGELLLKDEATETQRHGDMKKERRGDAETWGHRDEENIAASSPEACFHHALDIAHRQNAKSLELRAAMSLSRLWQRQAKKAEARQLLAEIYGWFTEGFDTVDLKEAKALLETMS